MTRYMIYFTDEGGNEINMFVDGRTYVRKGTAERIASEIERGLNNVLLRVKGIEILTDKEKLALATNKLKRIKHTEDIDSAWILADEALKSLEADS